MTLRPALFLFIASLLAGCVSTGDVDPMRTDKGRDEARDAYVQLGLGYLQSGASERAKVPLKKALQLDPADANAHAALALVFQIEMEPKLADEHYRKALAQRGDDARLLNNYGSFLFEQERYQEALERYQQAARDNLYPERSRVFENLGLTALKLDQREQAKAYFERSLRLNSRQPRALLELAQMYFDDRQYVPARRYYDSYSALAEQNARSLLLGARLAKIFQDRDTAASLGLQLRRLYPGTPEYQQYLSEQ
ncbi:type IV pilus biogenesis/stability protein PilW [Pseudomonas lalucatii]|uniref:Type IV pilus biogenesis/stability protein PilW n=1 Tax=Pseudomonas lalucatii TaxID=1424203 RepID=A0ABS5Q4G4_9PSED|nr:type IV pilus biogenesis/stability protein PilW [Pseudomonas lalucatii]MBS7663651.1 type IV pilus biogenesis/stability protein PilW [Pseudomonas lalucatii]MBS7689751.1 type IV pilus biogenesis/stability protein PilW [Pseudomonas lalucatii]MBS7725137.1 type IV pilus biogenesis/stability protein PilW [Pseudomonas lalucatii]QVM86894.1 type IV pilus biogenesis/stability protein PilW [Pseudomonas lalucatii]